MNVITSQSNLKWKWKAWERGDLVSGSATATGLQKPRLRSAKRLRIICVILLIVSYIAGSARLFVEAPEARGQGEKGERKRGQGEERKTGEGEKESFRRDCGDRQRTVRLQKLSQLGKSRWRTYNCRILCLTLLLEISPIKRTQIKNIWLDSPRYNVSPFDAEELITLTGH